MSLLPNLDELDDEQKMAVLESVQKSIAQSKEIQKRKIGENVDLVVQALKKIEEDIRSRYDDIGNAIEKRVASIKDGRDGIDGRDGKDGKDGKQGKEGRPGRDGKDGKNGLNGVDGQDGVSVVNAHIDFDGSLIISLSSGKEINVGEVVAPALAEQIKVITNGGGTSQSVLDTLTSLQSQIDAIGDAVVYKGLWNASTNSPTITSGVGTSGNFYIVSVAGSTNLDGITNWKEGDWAVFNGVAWQRVEGGADGNFTTVTASSLTSGRVTYAGAGGLLQDSSNLTFNGTTLTSAGFSGPLNGTVGATTPNTGAFTSVTSTSASGILTRAAATQDGVELVGRAGGTTSLKVTFTPTTLTASRTLTLPDASGTILQSGTAVTVAQGGTGITSGTSGGVPYFSSTSAIASSAALAANALVIGGGAGAAPSTTTTGTGVLTALGVNTGSAGAFVVNGGALGTPSSGTVTNLTGTASININGTVGATTPNTGAFTTLSSTGNTTLGDASTDTVTVNGYMGVGGGGVVGNGLQVVSSALSGVNQTGVYSALVGTSGGTNRVRAFLSFPASAAASYTVNDMSGFWAADVSKGAGSTITNLHGLYIADQTQGTNNYGITSVVSSGANKWNIYASGTANNYFAGNVGIGTTSPGQKLHVNTSSGSSYIQLSTGSNANLIGYLGANSGASTVELVSNSTYPLVFATNGAERARIDSSGNVGIGVTPSATTGSGVKGFEIGGIGNGLLGNSANVWATQNVYFNAGFKKAGAGYATMYNQSGGTHNWNVSTTSGGAAGDAITFTQAMTLDASSNLNLRGNFTAGSAVTTTGAVFGVDSGGSIAVGASSGDAVIRGAVGSGTTNRIVFAQGNTGNIYGLFDGSGNVGIGTSSPNDKLTVASDNYLSFQTSSTTFNSGRVARIGGVSVGSGNGYLSFETYQGGSGGGERMRLESDGLLQISKGTYTGFWIGDAGYKMFVTSGRLVAQNGSNGVELAFNASAWAAYSDIRAKTSLTPITDAKTKLKTARTVTGRYITDSEDVSRSFLIAQDWFEILPESVDASDPERLSLRYTETIPLIAAAVNEQTDEIAELKAIIESLTARIAALEAQ